MPVGLVHMPDGRIVLEPDQHMPGSHGAVFTNPTLLAGKLVGRD